MLAKRRGRRVALWALAVALVAGCASKQGPVEPVPPTPGAVRVEGGRVLWHTEVPARGKVRYGFAPGDFDHVAYPRAAGRRDRALVRDHDIPLLDLTAGRQVWFQAISEAPGAPAAITPVDSFVADRRTGAGLLTSTMIHIGFGDSHLITMPNGRRVLIDGGYSDAENSVLQYLGTIGVTHVDAMLATHIHADHLGGLAGDSSVHNDGLMVALTPDVFFDSPEKVWTNKRLYTDALETLDSRPIPKVVLQRDQTSADTPALAWDPQVFVRVLSSGTPPSYQPSGHEGTDINNDSIVLRFSYGDVDFIIGGDAEDASEASMVDRLPASVLDAEYYKVHHHGLPDASSSVWVTTVRPRVAFIPNTALVWDGDFEGAIAESSDRLRAAGADVYIIDAAPSLDRPRSQGKQYNVTFATDGISYEVRVAPATQSVPQKSALQAGCIAHDPDLRALGLVPAATP